jgi:hypothetical protein
MRPFIPILLLAVIAGLPTLAGDLVPIEGGFGATFFTEPVENPEGDLVLTGTITGDGLATRMGKSEITIVDTLSIGPNGFVANSETFVITAANGDELWAKYENMPSEVDSVTFVATLGPGLMEFVGGTGRFEGATGTAEFQAKAFLVTGTAEIEFEGEVSSVGSGL